MSENIVEKNEPVESTVSINNYNYALAEEFDYLDKGEGLETAARSEDYTVFSKRIKE